VAKNFVNLVDILKGVLTEKSAEMESHQLDRYRHKMHHKVKLTLNDSSTIEGNIQPWDDKYIYLTLDDGAAGGKVEISHVRSIEFPDD
jgi:hypothetical protein